jgi:DNA repair photolyase
MSVIYTPRGRALEYSLRGLELYQGCQHQCTYCYVPAATRQSRSEWARANVRVREKVLLHLSLEAPRYRGTEERVFLSFFSDPYQPLAGQTGVTRTALEILHQQQVPFQVLTKGGTAACQDFDLYTKRDAYAVTLTGAGRLGALEPEPGAASPAGRIKSLQEARSLGIETWVSLEPVLDPAASLAVIDATHDVVDLYKIGKINHDPQREAQIDWGRFAWEAVNRCEKYGVAYYIKKDLARFCDFPYRSTDNRRASWRQS